MLKTSRSAAVTGILASLAAAALAAGCAGGSAYGGGNNGYGNHGGGGGGNCTAALAPAGVEVVGVDLSTTSCNDTTYQTVLGFFPGAVVTGSHVVSVTHSSSDMIEFQNLDSIAHTAADLGPWSGSYPANGPDPAATPSPAGMDISAPGFTAGNINPGQMSAQYVANVPGVYVFGCAYHYGQGMRTVIIVQ